MSDLLAAYSAAGPGHDEMLQASGAARSAWTQLAARARLGSGEELAARAAEVSSLLADHGATGPSEQWRLDPLPVLLDEVEWTRLEEAVRQRAELLDQVLTDLYGPRRLLSSGILPPELVLSHPGYVRAADGIRLPGARQLVLTGTDVARNADGAWVALADHAQAPAGMGYAMEDRRVVSQVLAGPYRHTRTRRIGPFFHALGQALVEAAPARAGDGARVALLTEGPSSPTAFDEGYLASMLGIPLVQGTDLVVEDGRVWSRALDGRSPVDVLLRRVATQDCDPLELRAGSRLGTPGLVHAARTGAVSVVNPFGSGILENPALLTYLPRLSRALRDEELVLGSAVTYWCGERSMCSHVIANLARLTLTPVGASGPGSTVRGWELTIGERADLAVRISHRPWEWVGQEPVEASTTPTVSGHSLRADPTVLRTFAVARGTGYDVMAGALGHVTPDGGRGLAAPPHPAGAAKDVWVLTAEPYAAAESWPGEPELLPRRAEATGIAPRAALELFRLGGAAERAEGTARLVRAVADRRGDEGTTAHLGAGRGAQPGTEALRILLAALHGVVVGPPPAGPPGAPGTENPEAALPLARVITDADAPGTVAHAVAEMVRSAASVRDQLSPDTWLALSSLERTLARERLRRPVGSAAETEDELGLVPVIGRVLEGLLALSGVVAESMVHDVGWTLLEVGRRLERAQRLVAVLAATVTRRGDPAVDALVQRSVLSAHESVLTHRRRYPGRPPLRGMLELLLLDGANPRSLAFQLDRLTILLAELPAVSRGPQSRDQLLSDVVDLLAEMPLDAVVDETGPGGERTRLAESLASMSWRLQSLGEEIVAVHLTSPRPAQWPGEVWAP